MYGIQLTGAFLFLVVTHLQRYLSKKYQWQKFSIAKLAALILLYNAVCSVLVQLLTYSQMVVSGMYTWKQMEFPILLLYSVNGIVVLSAWSSFYFAFQAIKRWKAKEVETLKLQLSLKEAELEAIRSQLNPHFLFNSLNNIRSLVLEDPSKAREMITRLSAMMRYVIGYNRNNLVSVAEELEFLDHYVALEKIHFEDKLAFSSEVPEDLKLASIPPLGIQLLVENAIKHGIGTQAKGGQIVLSLHRQNGYLQVQVENTGRLGASSAPAGIGIQRLLERVAHSLDQPGTFNLHQTTDTSVTATLTLPFKKYENLHS
ncbi:histidine kinase [Nibribacter koreensis]|uniref:Histidine kinase n=2 Tax=Nibribacter koreensis TaxID=1084519 RepID=A0ABP8FWE3_9BACT